MNDNIFEHIFYEMGMYLWAHNKQVEFETSGNTETFDFNSVWITHCITLRNLLSFFMSPKEAEDISIKNFRIDGRAYQLLSSYNRAELKPLHKSIAHITEERISDTSLKSEVVKKLNDCYTKVEKEIYFFITTIQNAKIIEYNFNTKNTRNITKYKNSNEFNQSIKTINEFLKPRSIVIPEITGTSSPIYNK